MWPSFCFINGATRGHNVPFLGPCTRSCAIFQRPFWAFLWASRSSWIFPLAHCRTSTCLAAGEPVWHKLKLGHWLHSSSNDPPVPTLVRLKTLETSYNHYDYIWSLNHLLCNYNSPGRVAAWMTVCGIEWLELLELRKFGQMTMQSLFLPHKWQLTECFQTLSLESMSC